MAQEDRVGAVVLGRLGGDDGPSVCNPQHALSLCHPTSYSHNALRSSSVPTRVESTGKVEELLGEHFMCTIEQMSALRNDVMTEIETGRQRNEEVQKQMFDQMLAAMQAMGVKGESVPPSFDEIFGPPGARKAHSRIARAPKVPVVVDAPALAPKVVEAILAEADGSAPAPIL